MIYPSQLHDNRTLSSFKLMRRMVTFITAVAAVSVAVLSVILLLLLFLLLLLLLQLLLDCQFFEVVLIFLVTLS